MPCHSASLQYKAYQSIPKYESNRGEDIIDHLSKDWQLLAATTDVRIYEGRKAMADVESCKVMDKLIADFLLSSEFGHIGVELALAKDWQLLAATTDVRIYEGRKAMADDIARPTRRRKPASDGVSD